MKLLVVALGSRMPAWATAAWNEYARRLPKEFALELVEIKPELRQAGRSAGQTLASEATRIRRAIPREHLLAALDERGASCTSGEFAARLGHWREEARDVAFILGSADGLDPALKRAAAVTLALSALTLPHALARVVLVEQLYRAVSILQRHPYHRE